VIQVAVLLALVFAILIAVFAVQNTTAVAVTFLTFHSDSVAVSVLVLISAALGAAVMVLLGVWRELMIRWRHRAVAQQLKAAQSRISELEAANVTSPEATPVKEGSRPLPESTDLSPTQIAPTQPPTH
jgi:uncharacterized integral membrane protein